MLVSQQMQAQSQDDDGAKICAWIGIGIVLFVVLCLWERRYNRELAYEAYKQRQIVVKAGTVLQADCSFDPNSNAVTCDDLIVTYENEQGNVVTKTFTFAGDARNMQSVPQIGSRVNVAWTRGYEDEAVVRAVL